jgi:hypothetical protein
MKQIGLVIALALVTGAILTGCSGTSVATPVVTGGDRSGGTVDITYQHGRQSYTVNWDAARADASKRCQMWGYEGAELFPGGLSTCIGSDQYGCRLWQVTNTAQCLGDLEQ